MDKIIHKIERNGSEMTLYTELPLGKTAEEITNQFKNELHDFLKYNSVQGKVVRFNGRMTLAMGFAAGFALRNARAVDVDVWVEPTKTYYRVAGVHDPSSPVKFPWDVDMIVKAEVFGHEAMVKIVSVSSGDRLQVERGRQRAWIDSRDVIEFVRYANPNERI